MPIHKLSEGPITMTIASVELLPSNFDPTKKQCLFIGTNDERLYVSELSATKQMERMNLTPDESVGQTLHFEQVVKNGTKYTNINKGSGAMVGATPKAAPSAAAPTYTAAPKMTMAEITALYGECVNAALMTLGNRCEESGIPFDASAIQAAAATMFIKATR